jgi:hypothetical protein
MNEKKPEDVEVEYKWSILKAQEQFLRVWLVMRMRHQRQ